MVRSFRGGLELLDLVAGFDRAVLVDAIVCDEPVPGRVHELDAAGIAGSARLVGSHEVDLATALELGRRAGLAMPAEVRVIGIEAADVLSFRESLSPAVAAAAAKVARRLHDELSARREAPG